MRSKPYYAEHCGHNRPLDRYLGTFAVNGKFYDVHVYQDNALSDLVPDMHVCIRYGSKSNEYISPGNIKAFMSLLSDDPIYTAAQRKIRKSEVTQ